MRRPSIFFLPQNQSVPIADENSVLEVALNNKVDLAHSCGGMGSCTTCRIFVEGDADLPPRNELEQEIADSRGFAENERLACQLPPSDGIRIRTPPKR